MRGRLPVVARREGGPCAGKGIGTGSAVLKRGEVRGRATRRNGGGAQAPFALVSLDGRDYAAAAFIEHESRQSVLTS
jgi:hypothetical protein